MGFRLGVFLNSRHVGHLTREANGAVDFRYGPEWLAWAQTFPVSLSLPLREDRYIGAPVLAVFDNLLPDNRGLRRKIAERVGAKGVDAMSLLAALGRDCVGALQFLPDDAEPGPAGQVEGAPVSDAEIADMLRNLANNPLGVDQEKDFRISIAGAQEKTALLKHGGRWRRPAGTTPTTHILKPEIGRLPNGLDLSNSVENEYLCLKLTSAFDISTALAEMATFEDIRALIVERFDRLWTTDGRLLRVPQEDMCQALGVPWTQKYEGEGGPGILPIERLLAASDEPLRDRLTFLKANVVFWLLGATDGHAKNFSIFISPGGGFRLTPLYDVVSAQPSFDAAHLRHKDYRLAMAAGRSRRYAVKDIQGRHFVETAELAGIARRSAVDLLAEIGDQVLEVTGRVVGQLPKDFPHEIAESVVKGVQKRAAQLAARASPNAG